MGRAISRSAMSEIQESASDGHWISPPSGLADTPDSAKHVEDLQIYTDPDLTDM